MKKKLLSILLTFCMALTLLPATAFAEDGTSAAATEVSTAEALTNALSGNSNIVKLTGNIDITQTLTVTRTVTLDLNNHVLKMTGNDRVIKVESGGNLTLTDSAETKSEKKFAKNENGLWVLDETNVTETVTGGVITGGVATATGANNALGGGVFVDKNGTFTMNGGNIAGCTAKTDTGPGRAYGGGVFVAEDGGTFIMTDGSIAGCTAVGDSSYGYGGGVYATGTTTLSDTAEIRDCHAKGTYAYGGGIYAYYVLNISDDVKITGCTAVGNESSSRKTDAMHIGYCGVISGGTFDGSVENTSTISGGTFDGSVENSSSGKITEGTFNGDVENYGTITGGTFTGKVTGSGTITGATVIASVSTKEDFLAALKDKNVTTIQLRKSGITVEGTVTPLTIDRPITLVNGSGNSGCTLSVYSPLTIAEGGALTLDDGMCLYPFSSVTVNGSLTVRENSEMIFETAGTSLNVSRGATVTTQPAGNDTIAGLLSLGTGVTLTVEGTLENNGTLSVSDMENLKKAADIGGDLNLDSMTITEDYTLDMKGKRLSISSFLKFSNNANLTVCNASRVDATGATLTISGGSYYCPVYAGDSEYGITGGSFYGPVTVRYQGSSNGTTPTPISGGTFYGELKGVSAETDYSIQGNTVTFMDDGSKYAMQVVASNGNATAPDTPVKSGYTFAGWYLDEDVYNFATPVAENLTLTAKWTRNSSSSRNYYTIQATAGTGGAISPSGKISVREGRNQVFTITPDQGYAVSDVQIDGESVGAVTSYTFENVRKAHTIAVSFAKVKVFVDVPAGSYYKDAVDWAVENGITQGTDDTHFSPDDVCTRAQMVTFLWRAAGSPKVENGKNPFTDVKADVYYYDAVLWAVEKGVTSGTSATTFSPDATVTRGQTVTFLYRNAGSPEVSGTMPFTDVEADAYYAKAVQWAVQQKITTGTSETTFSPMSDCTRGQIVTFLYRAK